MNWNCGFCKKLTNNNESKGWTFKLLIRKNDGYYRCSMCPQCTEKYNQYTDDYFKDADLEETGKGMLPPGCTIT